MFSQISALYNFNKHFCKTEILFVLIYMHFVNLDKKKSKKKKPQNGITVGENLQGQKLSKILIAEDTIGDSYQ